MPHITPLLATHRVSVDYHVDGLSHKQQFLCDAIAGGGGLSGYRFLTSDASTLDVDDGVQAWANLIKAIMPSTNATLDAYTLEEYVSGAYVPLWSGTLGIAGTNAAGRSPYNRMTTVFRSGGRHLVRLVTMGVALVAPQRGGQGAAGGAFGTYFASLINLTGTNPGNWIRGRDDTYLAAGTFYTVSLDRKSRRRAGLI